MEGFPLLSRTGSPADLKKLEPRNLPALCAEIRRFIVESVSKTGGHLASSLGAVELAVAIHYVFDAPDDKVVWDVGHQAYAHKILTGRRDLFGTIRQTGGLSGFPKMSESPYDAFGTGHSSTSVSSALGMAVAAHLAGNADRWHLAVIGDGALTGGMAIEALDDAGAWKKEIRLLIILNDNECSISAPVGALAKNITKITSTPAFLGAREMSKQALQAVPPLLELAKRVESQAVGFISPHAALFQAFDLNYFGPVDGNDVLYLVRVLKNLKLQRGPMVLHVRTVKGKGYERAEKDPTAYHGVGRFDPEKGVEAAKGSPTYSEVFGKWLCGVAERDRRVYAVTPAMTEGSGMVEFSRRFPERFRDVSIAEQHAATYAAGLACGGMKPVAAFYSTFAQRAYDQILHDVALQGLPVVFALDRAGLVGADGPTHHGIYDIAMFRSMPGMTVFTPSDENEAVLALNTALTLTGPSSVRYPRGRGPGSAITAGPGDTIPVGVSRIVREADDGVPKGKRVTILAFGVMATKLFPAAEALGAAMVDMRFAAPIDREAVIGAARDSDLIITAEEGVLAGGAGSAVLEALSDAGLVARVMRVGIGSEVVPHGSAAYLEKLCGLDCESVASRARAALGWD